MKKNFESILLSMLLGISVLLGLSFWLNINFGFNLFCAKHWDELSKLQASHTPISISFYISIAVAIFIFIFGLYMIFKPNFRNIFKQIQKTEKTTPVPTQPVPPMEKEQITKPEPVVQATQINAYKPHRLNLPSNIREIAAVKFSEQNAAQKIPQKDPTEYNDTLAEIFSNNNYLVRKNPKISGFTANLCAIGKDEIFWIGGIDCDINKMKNAIQTLSELFSATLEDGEINIKAFLIDTMKQYNSDDTILVFNTIDELKEYISNNPGDQIIGDSEQQYFDAYTEFIDGVIKYFKGA